MTKTTIFLVREHCYSENRNDIAVFSNRDQAVKYANSKITERLELYNIDPNDKEFRENDLELDRREGRLYIADTCRVDINGLELDSGQAIELY